MFQFSIDAYQCYATRGTLLHKLWRRVYKRIPCCGGNRFLQLKKTEVYEKHIVYPGSDPDHRVAPGRICVQCKRVDPYIDRIGNYFAVGGDHSPWRCVSELQDSCGRSNFLQAGSDACFLFSCNIFTTFVVKPATAPSNEGRQTHMGRFSFRQ